MRLWPRGVKKNHIDIWYKELGTELELIKAWKSGKIDWSEFKKKYLSYIRQKDFQSLIQELAKRARKETITLLCSCEDESHCHRNLLKSEIEKYI
jgi:uncharacterized protein YeaO (DUF488 family)